MSDAMSFAQFEDQTAELLPARTLLSLMGASTMSSSGPGSHLDNDHPMYQTWMMALDTLGIPHASHLNTLSDPD